jgi:hypothetical protein
LDQVTCVTPTLSDAEPRRLIELLVVVYVLLLVGDVMVTVGFVVSPLRVTVSTSVLVFPAPSRTVTVITFEPVCSEMLPVDQDVVPDAVPLPPRLLLHVTLATPLPPESEAEPPKVMLLALVVYELLLVGELIVTVGFVVSRVTVNVSVLVLPAASRAVIVRTFDPDWREIELTDQFVVPLAVPLPPRLLDQVTWVTPTLSDAVPCSAIED